MEVWRGLGQYITAGICIVVVWLCVPACQPCINIPLTGWQQPHVSALLFSSQLTLAVGNICTWRFPWVVIWFSFIPVFHLQAIGYLGPQPVTTLFPFLSPAIIFPVPSLLQSPNNIQKQAREQHTITEMSIMKRHWIKHEPSSPVRRKYTASMALGRFHFMQKTRVFPVTPGKSGWELTMLIERLTFQPRQMAMGRPSAFSSGCFQCHSGTCTHHCKRKVPNSKALGRIMKFLYGLLHAFFCPHTKKLLCPIRIPELSS